MKYKIRELSQKFLHSSLLIGLVTVLIVTSLSIKFQVDNLYHDFLEFSESEIKKSVANKISTIEGVVTSLGGYYQASDSVSSVSFATISQELISNYPYISSIMFAKNVSQNERAEFEINMQDDGAYNFSINEYDSKKHKFIAAKNRSNYSSIIFIEPQTYEYTKLQGFDVLSNDRFLSHLKNATKTAKISTEKLKDFSSGDEFYFFIKSTYYGFGVPKTLLEKENQNSGYFILKVKPDDLLVDLKKENDKYEIKFTNEMVHTLQNPKGFVIDSFAYHYKIGNFKDGYLCISKYVYISDLNLLAIFILDLFALIIVFVMLFFVRRYFKAIDSIKKSELQLREVFKTSPIALRISSDSGQNVVFANPAYSKLLNLEEDDIYTQNPANFYVNATQYDEICQTIANNKSIISKMIELKISDNVTKWVLASYIPFEFNNEKVMLGWFVDITQQENQKQLLEERKNELQTVFDISKDGIAILDLKSKFLDFNDAYLSLTGYERDELLQKTCIEMTTLDYVEKSKEALAIVFQEGSIQNFEKPCIKKDGTKIMISMSIALMPTHDKMLVSAKDITKNKLFEEQSKLASMGEMIGNIAHQWRQPLSVITTIASGMKLRSEYGQLEGYDILPDMQVVMEQAKYLSKTIDDFRNFIKNTNEKQTLSIKETINKALSILHSTMVNHQIQVIENLSADKSIEGYENELIQAFINIINNAKDAIDENIKNDDYKFIFVETNMINKVFSIKIKDSGGGIPEDIIHRIFEPYFTTKHQSVGTGIGLDMAHKIISQRHNVKINVTNTEYEYDGKNLKGALFEIEF